MFIYSCVIHVYAWLLAGVCLRRNVYAFALLRAADRPLVEADRDAVIQLLYAFAWLPMTDIQPDLWYVRYATNTLSLGCAQLITPRVEAQRDADIQLHHRRF